MTDKNRCRPALDATIRFSIFVAKASLPVDLILLIHATRESLLPAGIGRAECTQSTVTNYRAATSFTRNLSRPGPAACHAEHDDTYRLIRQRSPLRRHAFGTAL